MCSITSPSVLRSCAFVFWSCVVSSVHGDLVVIPADNGSSSPLVMRFDDHTGALISEFSHETEGLEGMALGPDERIYVTSNTLGYGDVDRFKRNGQYEGHYSGANLRTPGAVAFGPDGNCYVIGSNWPQLPNVWQIWRYNGRTGVFSDTFVPNAGTPLWLTFGPNGNLYVADAANGIVTYNGSSGAKVGTFVPLGRAGLVDARSFVFGPDGNLYVASWGSNSVMRFNGATGLFIDYFVPSGHGGLNQPGGLSFGPDGNLYVSSTATHRVLRFNGHTGIFMDIFASHADLRFPATLIFTPPLPRLQLKHVGNQVQISWPSSSSPQNWSLFAQQSAFGTNQWSLVTNTITLSATNCVLSDRNQGVCAFYRLEQK